MAIRLEFNDPDNLLGKLYEASSIDFDEVVNKTLAEMWNRGLGSGIGGTPVSTESTRPGGPHGELRQSMKVDPSKGSAGGALYYSKEYAPHVEFGHRTRNGGYVSGQRFLYANVEEQEPILLNDLAERIRKVLGT